MSKFVSQAGSHIDQLQEQLSRRETNEDRESPLQPVVYDLDDDKMDSQRDSDAGSEYTDVESSQALSQKDWKRKVSGNSDSTFRRGKSRSARPSLPTVQSGITTDNQSQPTRNKKRRATAGNSSSDSSKLGTFDGVFTPTVLSIWGIIVFLRFGFIIAQVGVIATLMMFSVAYLINVLTTLSMSAISTNGTVRGGGTYYMISRSLGSPEFGGSIGIVFWMGLSMSAAMSAVGFSEPLLANVGENSGKFLNILPEGQWWNFTYGAIVLLLCTLVALSGPQTYARTSLFLAFFVLCGTLSIFASFALKAPFIDGETKISYTGFQWWMLKRNLWPNLTDGNTTAKVFGVLFPACNGILAGASMSGDLKKPSHSIPTGTLNAVWITYLTYCVIVILMGGSIDRRSMKEDLNILEDVSSMPVVFALGSLATAIYAILGGVVGASKIIQAIARDNLLPFLYPFKKGTPKTDTPSRAIFLTVAFILLVCTAPSVDIIASMVTLTALLTYSVLNLACSVLKVSAAPNFRPTFKYFRWWTAAAGMIVAISTMIFVSPTLALSAFGVATALFIVIHYTSPPKSWGNITQSLIYHQVRKYLLRLDTRKEHVKFWRPQILLLVNNPKTSIGLISFCNSLKKGGLYILGHTIKGDFSSALPELNRQQTSWLRYVDAAKVKAFTNITIAESERLGARSLVLGSGLGGMRPNIVIMGAYNIKNYRDRHHAAQSDTSVEEAARLYLPPSRESSRQRNLYLESQLPADTTRDESAIEPCDYVAIIEDLLQMNKSIGVGFGFDTLETMEASQEEYIKYHRNHKRPPRKERRYIDVWPIQVASPDDKAPDDPKFKSPLGTYTMILQLATILNMVQQWRKQYRLRVVCFVEHPEDIPEEQRRVVSLLENLRIQAELLVVSLSESESLSIGVGNSNFVSSYTAITQGKEGVNALVDALVVGTEWWQNTWNSDRKRDESHRLSLDLSSTRAIKSTKSIQLADSYGAETNTYLDNDPPSDTDTEPDVPPNAFTRFSQTPFMAHGTSPFDDFERRYSPPPLLSRFTSVPSSLTMRVNLPAVTGNSRVHYDSSSSSDDSYSSDEDIHHEEPSPVDKRYSNITSRITEPVLGAIGLGKSKLPREVVDRHSEEEGLGKLFGKGTNSSPGLVDSSSASRMQDYGSIQNTPLKSASTNSSGKRLEFNDLQSRAQNVIINELMRRISPSERTAVIFSALPAPLSGTHESNQDSITYIENLEVLVQDLPPVMLIHANSLTVTMSL
ncbi:hypothetical protein INT44_001024 [Umbelopsis vinacea]|uniref:Uncharacterized protein n=1 Tax=Umbelopsis vinacea TaxID=44442 RepID=A0A8H7UJH8_9FUNG|nr:hypothetical protein INT44_001024 [Umbelopsis vinacea]